MLLLSIGTLIKILEGRYCVQARHSMSLLKFQIHAMSKVEGPEIKRVKKETTASNDAMIWNSLKCSRSQLNLSLVLKCGQSFRWKSLTDHDDQFIGVLKGKVWILKQDDNHLQFKTFGWSLRPDHEEAKNPVEDEDILKDYFQLDVDLIGLYESWKKIDPIFEKVAKDFTGVRMLRQDPVENIFAFICSSNNNIQRISGMVEKLCTNYGSRIASLNGQDFYSFPTLDRLASIATLESELRTQGFGYRAGYIAKTAKQLLDLGGVNYLLGLRQLPYPEARSELIKLSGVGPKVADCILLMSLDQPSSVPVDTHMFQIAKQYLPHLSKYKSVTDKIYLEIGDHFRGLYGDYAGWAHSVLFSSDLRHFQSIKT